MKAFELNLDGLIGPTHNYAGLSSGNIASISNAQKNSNPQTAALQGLAKMRMLTAMGIPQAILPPQQRPNLQLLHQLGFTGKPIEQINKAAKSSPYLLAACYSASNMWAANSATVAPSTDSQDCKVHFTAANLVSNLHRQQEAAFTHTLLQTLFANPKYFKHHPPLPSSNTTKDEGSANHNRFCQAHGQAGIHLFVYGSSRSHNIAPQKYPARQTKEASEAIARNHLLAPNKTIFACQNPEAIDLGVFHNDVISVVNESVFLVHEQAFHDQKSVLSQLQQACDFPLTFIELSKEELTIEEAVNSYLFNSQLLTLPNKEMLLLAPIECQDHLRVKNCIDTLVADNSNPINSVQYLDLKQSMSNGGGPACLRLRIPLNDQQLKAMHQGVLVNEDLLDHLNTWVLKHYRTELSTNDLCDPQLVTESHQALDELTRILDLGSIYPFQKESSE